MLKNFSAKSISAIMAEEILRSGIMLVYQRGRKCEIDKEKIIGFLLFSKIMHNGYEEMELNSELFLAKHYDHSNFHYHYTSLLPGVICMLTSILEVKIKKLIDEILLHIADSSALSTLLKEYGANNASLEEIPKVFAIHQNLY